MTWAKNMNPGDVAAIEGQHAQAYMALVVFIDAAVEAIEETGSLALAAGMIATTLDDAEHWDRMALCSLAGCALVDLARIQVEAQR